MGQGLEEMKADIYRENFPHLYIQKMKEGEPNTGL